MRRYAHIKTTFKGLHYWKDCNLKQVEFLKNQHFHIFHVHLTIEQYNNKRDIEYISTLYQLDKFIESFVYDINGNSCEDIAERIHKEFKKIYPERYIAVSVFEDDNFGGEVCDN